LRASLYCLRGKMICDPCKKAADLNAVVFEKADKEGTKPETMAGHPQNCACPCMHKTPGAWKGVKR
jgi:hypothetical protein